MWFISVEVEQETSAPPPKKKPGSAPVEYQPQPNKEATEHVERQLLVEVYRVSELLILSNQVCVVWI